MWAKDTEIIELRRLAGCCNRDLANMGGVSPATIGQCTCGYQQWQGLVREKVIKGLRERIAAKANEATSD